MGVIKKTRSRDELRRQAEDDAPSNGNLSRNTWR